MHREFDHILTMQKYVTHNFVSSFHGQKMDVGFNLALFIFRSQLLRRFSEKEKYKTGILATRAGDNQVKDLVKTTTGSSDMSIPSKTS